MMITNNMHGIATSAYVAYDLKYSKYSKKLILIHNMNLNGPLPGRTKPNENAQNRNDVVPF